MKRIVLGSEYDARLRDALRDILQEMGGKVLDKSCRIGGSQQVETLQVSLGGRIIGVEAETYIGLSMEGDEDLVDQIALRIRARLNS